MKSTISKGFRVSRGNAWIDPEKRLRFERAPMQGARSEPRQRGNMSARRIAGVLGKAIAGVGGVEANHQRVARHFGDDRGGGDRQRLAIAADDRARWTAKAGRRV